jgi:hypothetical protein
MDHSSPTLSAAEYEQRKQLLEDLKMLDKSEYEEIYRLIHRDGVEYTENSNGVFFDLTLLSQTTIIKLVKFLDLCKAQRKNEETRVQELNTFRQEVPTMEDGRV